MPLENEKSQGGIRLPYAVQNKGMTIMPFRFLKNYSDQNSDQVWVRLLTGPLLSAYFRSVQRIECLATNQE